MISVDVAHLRQRSHYGLRDSGTGEALWRLLHIIGDSIATKLKRGTFAATFLIGCMAALEIEGVQLAAI